MCTVDNVAKRCIWIFSLLHYYQLPLNRQGRRGTTDDLAPRLCDLANSRPVHFLMLSAHLCLVFFPLSRCLATWFWPDMINGRRGHTTPVCVSLQWSRWSSSGPIACWILARTSSLVTWSCLGDWWGWSLCSCDSAADCLSWQVWWLDSWLVIVSDSSHCRHFWSETCFSWMCFESIQMRIFTKHRESAYTFVKYKQSVYKSVSSRETKVYVCIFFAAAEHTTKCFRRTFNSQCCKLVCNLQTAYSWVLNQPICSPPDHQIRPK